MRRDTCGRRETATMSDISRSFINLILDVKAHTQMPNPNTLPLSNRLVYRRSSSNRSSRCCRRVRIKSREISHLSKNERFLLLLWTKTNSRNDVRLDAHACSPQGLVAHLLRRQRIQPAEQNRFPSLWLLPRRWCWICSDGIIGKWNRRINATVWIIQFEWSMCMRRACLFFSFDWKNNRPSDCCFCGTIHWLW